MPYIKNYKIARKNIAIFESFFPSFINKNMGDQAVIEHQKNCKERIQSDPDDASFENKYEIAYSNWIRMSKSNFSFIRKNIGENGIMLLIRHEARPL